MNRMELLVRRLRRAIVVWVRRRIHLAEDDIRDQLVDGLRRDLDHASETASQMMGLIETLADGAKAQAEVIARWRKESATLAMIEESHARKIRREMKASGQEVKSDLHIVSNGKSDKPMIEVEPVRILRP